MPHLRITLKNGKVLYSYFIIPSWDGSEMLACGLGKQGRIPTGEIYGIAARSGEIPETDEPSSIIQQEQKYT